MRGEDDGQGQDGREPAKRAMSGKEANCKSIGDEGDQDEEEQKPSNDD